jgi:hypothetical protein
MTDPLSQEIERTAQHLLMLDATPGWQEQVAHRIAELKREPWWPQLRDRIKELRAASSSTSPAPPSEKDGPASGE